MYLELIYLYSCKSNQQAFDKLANVYKGVVDKICENGKWVYQFLLINFVDNIPFPEFFRTWTFFYLTKSVWFWLVKCLIQISARDNG